MTDSNQALKLKDQFLAKIAPDSHFDILFNHIPGISFFAKNKNLELISANKRFWERLTVNSEAELIGKNDFQLFPQRLAENFRKDDMEVMKMAQPKLDILELFFDSQGLPDWFLTNKFPIFELLDLGNLLNMGSLNLSKLLAMLFCLALYSAQCLL